MRFMIDASHQGKGYGKLAIIQLIEHLKTFPRKPAPSIYLSYKPDNEAARKLYASIGFKETGEISCGETVARLII